VNDIDGIAIHGGLSYYILQYLTFFNSLKYKNQNIGYNQRL
jgi:hypothetical protein